MKTHGLARAFNWSAHDLIDEGGFPLATKLLRALGRLNSEKHWGFAVFFIPPERDIRFVDFREFPDEYLQSAGSAESLTVEIRRREPDGELRQYAIGRDVAEEGAREITWPSDDPEEPHRLVVPAFESFTAEQALPIYEQYAEDKTIPDGYRLRRLEL